MPGNFNGYSPKTNLDFYIYLKYNSLAKPSPIVQIGFKMILNGIHQEGVWIYSQRPATAQTMTFNPKQIAPVK